MITASYLFAESVPLWKGILIMVALLIGVLIVGGVGAYVLLRIFASLYNSRQSGWESSAAPLGLSVDRNVLGMSKPLVGERDGVPVKVTYYTINPRATAGGAYNADDCAQVEVPLKTPIPFSFEISRKEAFYQKVASKMFDYGELTGHEPFDDVFKTESSDMSSIQSLLNVEMLDAESSTLLTDLMNAAQKYQRVILTDRAVTLGIKAEFGQSELIAPVIDRAIYLASRVERASQQLA